MTFWIAAAAALSQPGFYPPSALVSDPTERTQVANSILAAVYGADAPARAALSISDTEPPWKLSSGEFGVFEFFSQRGRAVGFRSHALESRSGELRSPEYHVSDESAARLIADQIAVRLGAWKFESCQVSEDLRDDLQSRMVHLGSVICRYTKQGDVPYLVSGNELLLRLDRRDGVVLSVSLVTSFRPVGNEYVLSPDEAARRASDYVSSWKTPEDRTFSAVQSGFCHDERLRLTTSDTMRDIIDSYPAYRFEFADESGSFLVLAASDGRILVDGRRGRR